MSLDSVTEAIAHFIGQFQVDVEQARARSDYDDFRFRQAAHHDAQSVLHHKAVFTSPLDLQDFTPNFHSFPMFGEGWQQFAPTSFVHPLPQLEVPTTPPIAPMAQIDATVTTHNVSYDVILPEPEAPGSMVLYLNQHAVMEDGDYLSVGGNGLDFDPVSHADAQVAVLSYAAEELSPLSGIEQPASPADIATYLHSATAALDSFAEDMAGRDDVTIVKGQVLSGVYVNGELTDDVPVLKDHLPFKTPTQASDNDAPKPTYVAGEGTVAAVSNVSLETGNNLVVNETHISNIALGSPVIAVAHDSYELNAIVQVNAVADHDSVSSYLSEWGGKSGPSQTFNIAQFDHVDAIQDKAAASADDSGLFPSFWSVTKTDGDLVFLNWVKQFAFINDNDVVVASASGSKTSVVMGDNQSINAASISELGHYYDLILVGGSIYSANTITQINILVDNDTIGAVSGFHTSGAGTVSTGDNLLWNSASIVNIGGADRFQPLTDAYKATLASGGADLSQSVLHDTAFAGMEALRVLYVTGNIYNLNSIEQHTVLGDSDQVALAMSAVAADPTANWSVVTGSNALANVASITNLDSMGKTYVGGTHYSDAMLVQAGLVPTAADLHIGAPNPDALVNEAIAFLTDAPAGLPTGPQTLALNHSISPDHPAQSDALHGMLS